MRRVSQCQSQEMLADSNNYEKLDCESKPAMTGKQYRPLQKKTATISGCGYFFAQYYQLAFLTPGINPCDAISRN
jgi:hypothetical protein